MGLVRMWGWDEIWDVWVGGVLCICGKKCNFVGYLRWYYS